MATARATSEAEAANGALAKLGEPPIATLDDPVDRARAAKARFAAVRDKLLRAYEWNFATGWITPAADVVLSVGPLKNRFPLPDDCLRVRFLSDTTGQPIDDDWAIEAGTVAIGGAQVEVMCLVTNVSAPLICYTRRIATVRTWDPEFLETFEYALAEEIAPQVAKDINAAEKMGAKASQKIDQAAKDDAREMSEQRVSRETSWVTSRVIGVVRSRASTP